ncbi:hypothetical protein TWF506_009641 [Arthrobotrys conoides]|uniref:Uncharacterized protein n=1 Tax=Arthrobotrys conoides TaxID=74498 RepID=A0AAN8RWI2_9PEZI
MPLNWDLTQEISSEIDATDEIWQAEPQDQYLDLLNETKIEEDHDQKLESDVQPEQSTVNGVCPHCGSDLSTIKPIETGSAGVEVVVYTDYDRTRSQNSPASTTPSSCQSMGTRPEDPFVISDDEKGQDGDSDRVRINPYTGRCVQRWTERDKLDLYILKMAYKVSNKELSKILSQKHQKSRKQSSCKAQFAEYKQTALNHRLYRDVAKAITNDELYRYSEFTSGLKSAARRIGIGLVLRRKQDIRISDTPLTCRNTRKDRGNDDEGSDSDSSVSSSK